MKNPSPDRVAIEEGIVIGQAAGRDLKVDVFTPPGAVANRAGVLLIHGGSWTSGDRAQLHGYGILLGRVGYTCVACEYRLTGEASWPAQIDDVRAAFQWMRSNARELEIDVNRIAVEGHSAGGHLSLMLAGTTSSEIAACIAVYPPTDLDLRSEAIAKLRAANPAVVDVVSALLGSDPSLRKEASPVTHVTPSFPPTMLVHGNADIVVDVEHTFRMYRALTDAAVKTEMHIFEGQHHAFDRDPQFGRQLAALMTLFLNRHLAPPPAPAK
jgi:acetyl esterase/lipase